MARRAQMADGTVLEFPDNTPDDVIDRVAKQHATSKPAQGPWWGEGRAAPRRPSAGRAMADSAAAIGGGMFRTAVALPDMLADAGDALTRGATSLASGGLRALGADGVADVIERGSPGNRQQPRMGQIPDMLGTPRPVAPGAELGANILGGLVFPMGPKSAPAAPVFAGTTAPGIIQRTAARVMRRPAPVATRPSYASVAAPVLDSAPRKPVPQYAPGVSAEVVEAGARRGVPVRAPDAIPATRGEMAKVEASPYGGPRIASTLDGDKALMQARVAEVGGPGTVHSSRYSLGGQVQDAGRRFISKTREVKNAAYSRAERFAGGARVNPQETIAAVDQNIAELSAAGPNSNANTINFLKGLRDDLSKPDGFSITEFQGLRAANRAKIKGDQALTMSDADRRLGNIMSAFTDDASKQLPERAVGALRTADRYYAERQAYINEVLQKFMGGRRSPLAPEKAAGRLTDMGMSKGSVDYTTLSRFMAKATPDERADIAATFAENLGKNTKNEFGLDALARNIDKMPANVRALVFGKDGAAALDDLRILARAKSDTAGGLNNSRSGVVMARQIGTRLVSAATAGGMATGSWVGAVIAPAITETMAVIGQRRAANLLLNPRFTKTLRSVGTNPSPAAAKVLVARLADLAGRNPAIAEEVTAFAQALNAQVPMRAAASAGETPEDQRR